MTHPSWHSSGNALSSKCAVSGRSSKSQSEQEVSVRHACEHMFARLWHRRKGRNVDRDSLVLLLAQGVSVEQIGRRFGKHPSTISYWMNKFGLGAPNRD